MASDVAEQAHKEGPSPISYTADEVGKKFVELLASFDFAMELHEAGIGSLGFFRRRKAKRTFTALCVALWHVALAKSFPNDADTFFAHFVATYPPLAGERRRARKMRDLVTRYDALVSQKKDADFTLVAKEIADSLNFSATERPRRQLKMSLRIRAIYEQIFEKMI